MYLYIFNKVKKNMKKQKTLYPKKTPDIIDIKEIMTVEFLTFILIAIIFMLSIIFAIGETSYYNIIL